MLSAEEYPIFSANPKAINWKICVALFIYGIQKYIMKQDVNMPHYETSSLIQKYNRGYFDDFFTIIQYKGQKIKSANLDKLFPKVLYSERVQSKIGEY